MALTKYSPFTELDDFVNRIINAPASQRPWAPPVDILETENELVLKADIAGLEMKDIEILMENGTLTLKGERKFENPSDEKSGYHRIERSFGSFARYFSLPETVDAEKVHADYKNGVLTVTLPKKEVAKPRTIKISLNNN